MHRARDMIASAIRGARHYNGRLSQEPEQKSTVRRAFRQARQLAERQKAEDVKHQFNAPPPPPANKSWRSRSNFTRKTQVLVFAAIIWRRGVPGLTATRGSQGPPLRVLTQPGSSCRAKKWANWRNGSKSPGK